MKAVYPFLVLLLWQATIPAFNQPAEPKFSYIDLSKFEDGIHHWELYSRIRTTERLDTADITGIAGNLLAYQNDDGGWPKNIDWLAKLDPDSVIRDLDEHYRKSTFDNRNTFPQIEYLAKVYQQTGEEKYLTGAEQGFHYILDTEYPNGGWRGWDADVITFNDEVMTGVMNLLLDISINDPAYEWLSGQLRDSLMAAYKRGLDVILKCQVEIKGKKTGWCQQHDFSTYAPAQGRTYEHPSVTANESCDIILFLMRLENPEPLVSNAIESAVQWLKEAQIPGYRYDTIRIAEHSYHKTTVDYDLEFIPDPLARPIWARFYDLEESRPFLSKRDGTIVYDLKEISFDRRLGYSWYGYWPEEVLEVYPEWKAAHDPEVSR
ncbi:MAG: pectate lyase [Bacteroidales bacterium]|nr:pectate lyase [Bacteroidales bacterium]